MSFISNNIELAMWLETINTVTFRLILQLFEFRMLCGVVVMWR
jgi:hypothetical protein